MTFVDIEILDFGANGIERIADDESRAHVPYVPSHEPPELWTRCFLSKTADDEEAPIIGSRAIRCVQEDKIAIKALGMLEYCGEMCRVCEPTLP